MKKIILMMAVLMLSLTFVACDKTKTDIYEIEESKTISNLMNEVLNDVQPGTAGCSLKAVSVACDMLNFSGVLDENAMIEFDGFYAGLSAEDKEIFNEAWGMAYGEAVALTTEDEDTVKEKLDLAGCLDKNNYPWSNITEFYAQIDNRIVK